MQQELKELQPELIQTSKETEELIEIIAEEASEVEEKKMVSERKAIEQTLLYMKTFLVCEDTKMDTDSTIE
jgi:hypothetical protein